jgi:hypothetical protein
MCGGEWKERHLAFNGGDEDELAKIMAIKFERMAKRTERIP